MSRCEKEQGPTLLHTIDRQSPAAARGGQSFDSSTMQTNFFARRKAYHRQRRLRQATEQAEGSDNDSVPMIPEGRRVGTDEAL